MISPCFSQAFVAACVALPLAVVSSAASGAPATFRKDASQFCVSRLDADKQAEIFSRIMNLGASYSHGCTMCDASPTFRAQVIADGEFNFARRNFLAQFLHRGAWKNPSDFKFEFMTILENDFGTNLAEVYPKKELRKNGYDGKWVLYPDLDRVGRTTPEQDAYVKRSQNFKDESALVGSGFLRRDLKTRDLARVGHVYQTVPGRFADEGARQKVIFDLALDRARSFDMMRAYGDAALFDRLVKRGWRDAAERERLVSQTVDYLRSFGPSVVFSVDSLFWDAVPQLFHYARLENPRSLVAKLITMPAVSKLIGLDFYDDIQRENMTADYYEVLARLSVGSKGVGGAGATKPVPVLLGRLIDSPGSYIKSAGLEAEFGMLIGVFASVFTGRDFTAEITDQLKKLSYDVPTVPTVAGDAPTEGLTPSERAKVRDALARADAIAADYYSKNPGALAEAGNGTKPALPWIVRGAVNAAIFNALGDLPLLVKSADRAFTTMNRYAREATSRTDNNVHLVNVDEFYRNFHTIVNSHTMHPSVAGAGFMADLVDRALCDSVGPTP